MPRSPRATAIAALGCAAACLALAGCFGMPAEKPVAATVNGERVYEADVTDYIEGFRSSNREYETDAGWAEFLVSNKLTSEGVRTYVLENNFIPKLLVRQECAKRAIALTDEQLDKVIERERAYYEQRYGENSWNSVLASYGYDEASWRENESDRLLEEQLERAVIEDSKPSRSEVQEQANESASSYNGKHSRYIAFPSEDEARRARGSLRFSDGGTVSAKAFRKLSDEVRDGGWNSLPSARDALSSAYLAALNGLSEGGVSEAFEDGGSWLLVYCDGVFNAAESDGYVALSSLPGPILRQVESDARSAKREKRFRSWLDKVTDSSDISVASMPEGLPYSVNIAIDQSGREG